MILKNSLTVFSDYISIFSFANLFQFRKEAVFDLNMVSLHF